MVLILWWRRSWFLRGVFRLHHGCPSRWVWVEIFWCATRPILVEVPHVLQAEEFCASGWSPIKVEFLTSVHAGDQRQWGRERVWIWNRRITNFATIHLWFWFLLTIWNCICGGFLCFHCSNCFCKMRLLCHSTTTYHGTFATMWSGKGNMFPQPYRCALSMSFYQRIHIELNTCT